MDNSNILATLAKLEESISGIDSAKKQVDDVVKGYGDAKKAFDVVAKTMSEIKGHVDSVIKAVKEKADSLDSESKAISTSFKERCDAIIQNTKVSLEVSQKSLENGVDKSVFRLNGALETLEVSVLSLNKLKEDIISALAKIDALSEELKEDKSEIISKLHQETEDVDSKITEKASEISNVIETKSHETISKLHQETEDVESKIVEKASEISNVIETKSHEIINIESENTTILSTIKSALDTIKNEQDKSRTQLNAILEQQKTIKTISIITLVIIVLGFVTIKFM